MRVPIAIVLAVVALLCGSLGVIGPWWSIRSSGFERVSYTGTMNLGLSEYSTTISLGNDTVTGNYSGDPHIASVMLAGAGLSGLALILGGASVLVIVFPGRRAVARGLTATLGGAGGLAAFGAAIYVMTQLPGAASEDLRPLSLLTSFTGFWGSGSGSGMGSQITLAWSAGWGWYAVLISGILLLVVAAVQAATWWRMRSSTREPSDS